mgnify:CR=1 FL=1
MHFGPFDGERGNAGAGGCFLARAADCVWVRNGVMLNPHYKNMGNLYGSEYWTYTLPRRVKQGAPRAVPVRPNSRAVASAINALPSWLRIAPLGLPVVPEE